MTSFLVVFLLVFGVNTLLWTTAGAVRIVAARVATARARTGPTTSDAPSAGAAAPGRDQVAVLMAAHNEEAVIGASLDALATFRPLAVFIVSDGSSDATVAIARAHGAEVLDLTVNRGKAGALVEAIRHFRIAERFEVLLLLDADTRLAPDYLDTGLPAFADPGVVAVAGRATSLLVPRSPTRLGRLLVAYRERVYIAMQYLFKFGMAARYANVVPIVPGFASMYRTRILADIDIAAPGLSIEDYNMTFEVHAKRLGRIAFHPSAAIAITQDPDTPRDYARQVARWNLGFWQTVLRHRFRPQRFWFALTLFIAELAVSSIALVLLVPLLLASFAVTVLAIAVPETAPVVSAVSAPLPPLALLLGVVVPDYLLTVLAAAVTRQRGYLVWGLVFPVLRVVDAWLCLTALLKAVFGRSTGAWKSPARRPMAPAAGQPSSEAR